MKTAIISGASGFIGHHLCNELFPSWKVIGIGSSKENMPKCHQFIDKNLNEINWSEIPPIDICFHQGANNDTTEKNREKMFQENLVWGANFFDSLLAKNCRKFIFASSCSIYGNEKTPYKESYTLPCPLNPYAESKYLFEKYALAFGKKHDVTTIGLRYSNVYGVGETHKGKRASMITQLIQKATMEQKINLFKHGEQKRDWVYIDDVITANLLCLLTNKSGVYNIGSGTQLSFNDLIKIIETEFNKTLSVDYIDCLYYDNYQSNTLTDINLAKTELGYFSSYTPEQGIKDYIKKAG